MNEMSNEMTPEDAKASLGIATFLQDQMMPKGQPQEPNPAPEPPSNQQNETDLKTEMTGLESRIMDEIGTLKEEIKKSAPKDSGSEIEALKKQIEDVLNSDE